MTTPPVVFGQFGRTLAFAERALTATLRRHLAERQTDARDLVRPAVDCHARAGACPEGAERRP